MSTNTILISLSGPDQPGITAPLMTILTGVGAEIEDVEQIVIRGKLILSLIARVDADTD